MGIGSGRAITLVVGHDNQCFLAECAGEQCQHIDLSERRQIAEVGGALGVAGNGAVAADHQLARCSLPNEGVWPYYQFREVFLSAVGSLAAIEQRDPFIDAEGTAVFARLARLQGLTLCFLFRQRCYNEVLALELCHVGRIGSLQTNLSADKAGFHHTDVCHGVRARCIGCWNDFYIVI